jgi:hypothetical protein
MITRRQLIAAAGGGAVVAGAGYCAKQVTENL